MHGGAIGSGAPEGKRNGGYLHGGCTKDVLAALRQMRAWMKVLPMVED